MWFGLCVVPLVVGDPLRWRDPKSSAEFDWSGLQRAEPWVVVSQLNDEFFTTVYSFRFGGNLERSCSETPAAAVMQVEVLGNIFEKCAVLGRHEMSKAQLIDAHDPDAGVAVTYKGGDLCSDLLEDQPNEPREVSFRLRCGDRKEERFRLVGEEGKAEYETCNLVFETYTSAGCPRHYATQRLIAKWCVLVGCGGVLLYFCVVSAWRACTRKHSELPFNHILSLAWDGCRFSYSLLAPCKQRLALFSNRYSAV